MISLMDDGTLDTVLACDRCGQEFRYNYSAYCDDGRESDTSDEFAYDRFVDWAIADASDDHDCPTEAAA